MSDNFVTDDWYGLYGENWKGEIVPEAFAHPAKFARGLIRRIYQHAVAEGWLREGDVVLDPFGGVALGALDAMTYGTAWVGMELEPRFVALGNQNIDLWDARYGGKLPRWGAARLLQGDSRHLTEVLGMMGDGVVSSPPFNENKNNATHGETKGFHSYDENEAKNRMKRDYILPTGDDNLGNMKMDGFDAAVSSPPYADQDKDYGDRPNRWEMVKDNPNFKGRSHWRDNDRPNTYGETPGNLADLKVGDFDAAVSSPPFSEPGMQPVGKHQGTRDYYTEQGRKPEEDWSKSSGQLGAMKTGEFDAAVSSPPFENSYTNSGGEIKQYSQEEREEILRRDGVRLGGGQLVHSKRYGNTGGQLGQESGDTFWLAARTIVEQTYIALRPGGHALWVVKAFIKNKKIVPFPDQWRQLCEAVGFKTLHEHRAWVIEDRGTQFDLNGNGHHKQVERKSFFRKLHEAKGTPRIDWEVVLCLIK